MKAPYKFPLIKFLLGFIAITVATSAFSYEDFPRDELPFCPGGGPTGWLNYFDY